MPPSRREGGSIALFLTLRLSISVRGRFNARLLVHWLTRPLGVEGPEG